jgi:predicted nucleic acid-binding protein
VVPRYLADTSIWSWANRPSRPDIAEKLATRVDNDEIVTCVPVVLEVLHRADSFAKYEQLYNVLFSPLGWLDLTDETAWRALEIQQGLAAQSDGAHRRPIADFLIAAIAESHDDVVLWAFDDDYRIIAGITDQSIELEVSTGPGH